MDLIPRNSESPREGSSEGDFKSPMEKAHLPPFFDASLGTSLEGSLEGLSEVRAKSSLRLHYEAQVRVIQSQIGSLEKVRENLGLSQRKMAQLLLVDPSAWTRWTRPDGEAPPHIWRALQWYLTLKEKIPGLTPQYFVNMDPQVIGAKTRQEIEIEKKLRETQVGELKKRLTELEGASVEILVLKAETKQLRRWNLFWATCSVILAAMLATKLL